EYQDRGVPHVHWVLWTQWTMDQLIEANNSRDRRRVIITTTSKPVMDYLADIVQSTQRHRCYPEYCFRSEGDRMTKRCRFGYPKRSSPCTRVDEHGRFEYERAPEDSHINAYNPDLLKFCQSTIDL
ncbi:MAG: hypothetical protein J3Q66DRAFT_259530, partial [Benniella sp.]